LFSNRKYKIQLVREGKKWVDDLLKNYNLLYNMVYAENTTAIKWLKSLGFTFINYHAEYGKQSKPFYEFLRIA
jgi:ribosomal protein S18 acetylase RimI-like enzyme